MYLYPHPANLIGLCIGISLGVQAYLLNKNRLQCLDWLLTSTSSEHDEENRVEEAERHDQDVLVEHGRKQEHHRHGSSTIPVAKQLQYNTFTIS